LLNILGSSTGLSTDNIATLFFNRYSFLDLARFLRRSNISGL